MLNTIRQRSLRCTIIHSLPGRVRLRCDNIKFLEVPKTTIENTLKKISFIKDVYINKQTGSALILYNEKEADLNFLKRCFSYVIEDYSSLQVYKQINIEKNQCGFGLEKKDESVKAIIKRITITAATLLYSSLRNRNQYPDGPVDGIRNIVTLPSVVSLALTAPIFCSGLNSIIKERRPNEDTLTATSILASLLLGKDTSALTIILISNIAELLTEYTMERTRKSIKNMLNLNQDHVWRVNSEGLITKVKIEEVKKDDKVVVHTGEKICVDGVVISGEGAVDQSSITGEYMPSIKKSGDKVFAGTILKNGTLTVNTETAGDNTVVSRIIRLVDEAASNKAPMQNYANKFSRFLLPVSFLFSAVTYLATKSPTRALNMLIIDFCCGVKLSTATAFSAAISNAIKNGVLIKGGNFVEAMASADTLIFDKTGTLTEGKPQVTSIITIDSSYTEKEIVELAAAAEETSNHPLALGILNKLKDEQWEIPLHGEIKTYVSRGTETSVEEDLVRVGSKVFMEECNINMSTLKSQEGHLIKNGEKLIYVALNDKLIGIIGIQDKVRENMKKAINNLRYKGIDDIILLTGDLTEHAEITAMKMGVDSFEAELLPDDKAKVVQRLKSKGSKVIMVGDGVNDAPALAYADVGISLGSGSTDIAIETSDVTIQRENPMMLPKIINLSQKTMDIIKQNFALVFTINSAGIILSAAGVLPVLWGAILHNSSTVLVVANSIRLLFLK